MSIILICLVHYLFQYLKDVLTVPKIKYIINEPIKKYQNIYEIINQEKNHPKNNQQNQQINHEQNQQINHEQNQQENINYSNSKTKKPKALFLEEIEFTTKNKLIDELKLNHHKYRYVVLPLDFDFKAFSAQQMIVNEPKNIIIQYNGVEKAEVVL